MQPSVVLGIGSGRCGTESLAKVLNQQQDAHVTHEQPPLLPWQRQGTRVISQRLARMRRRGKARLVGDVASFYLPYIEDAIRLEPGIRIICLKRPRQEVVHSFCRWLDRVQRLPTNHWAAQPAPGWHHDPVWTPIFPKYSTQDREEGIGRYWDEYYATVEQLLVSFPQHLRLFDMRSALNTEAGQRELLSFAGIESHRQVLKIGLLAHRPPAGPLPQENGLGARPSGDRRRCAVLVPYSGHIHPQCEHALRELERRGYAVQRVGGYAAIDQGRNQMATDVLRSGFEETMWIDADIVFDPDAVDQLRAHDKPIVCGVYPQKGRRAIACHVLPGTEKMVFGQGGGLVELRYAATGFLYVRREVYERMQQDLHLPLCNERFGRPTIPFFLPMVHEWEDGYWYLAEDYAFCERARQCGFSIWADTSVRLWHVGNYSFGWEDAGAEMQRNASYTLHFPSHREEE